MVEDASCHSNGVDEQVWQEKHEEYEDYLYTFFQNCWHLKDWILNDTEAPPRLTDAVRIMDEHKAIVPLMLCSGLANGSKHLRQTTRDSKRRAKTISEIEVVIDLEGHSETTYAYKVIDDHGNSYEAIELARDALKEWERIIRQYCAGPAREK